MICKYTFDSNSFAYSLIYIYLASKIKQNTCEAFANSMQIDFHLLQIFEQIASQMRLNKCCFKYLTIWHSLLQFNNLG